MNKKEVSEIKRQIKMDNKDLLINNIGIYYVNKENKIICSDIKKYSDIADMTNGTTGNPKYWDQLDEENFLEIFKKTLSGQLGKGIVEYNFPNEILLEKDNCYSKLLNILNDDLENKKEIDEYINFVAESLNKNEEYAICLLNASYTLPIKDINGNKVTDEDLTLERNEYHFIILSICPMELSNLGLFYNKTDNNIVHKNNVDKVVQMPIEGFIFPAFNDRSEDVNSVLVFNKKTKEPDLLLIQEVLGCIFEMNAEDEKEKFNTLLTKIISNSDDANTSIDYNLTKNIHSIIADKINENILDTEMPTISKSELKSILKRSGVDDEKLKNFEDVYQEVVANDKYQFKATNVINASKLDIKSPDIVINVKTDKTDKITAKQIDGKRCLVVELDDTVNINGLNVSIK